jgi:hypothetical protein
VRALLLASHVGDPAGQVPLALEMFALYGVCAFAGWLLVGLPVALFFPARTYTRLTWPLRLMIGAGLGPLAMFIIFFLLAKGQINSQVFTATGIFWIYSIVVSTVSFAVYVALLGKSTGAGTDPGQAW